MSAEDAQRRNARPIEDVTGHMDRPLQLWASLCAGCWLLTGFVAYAIAGVVATGLPIAGQAADFEVHRWTLTIFVATWVALGSAVVIGVTAFLLDLPRGGVRRALPWVVCSALIGAALELTLLEWGAARYGSQGADPEWLRATAFLAIVVATLGFGMLAQLVAPRAGWLVRAPTIGTGVVALVIVASNVPGLGDGIEAASLPLAAVVALSAAYALAAVTFSVKGFGHR